MLPKAHRLRQAGDWAALRRGASCGRETVVIKVAGIAGDRRLAGLAVSRAVGGAVVRNSVKRRLRAILADLLDELPPGRAVLVRALPPAALARYDDLERDVREGVFRAMERLGS